MLLRFNILEGTSNISTLFSSHPQWSQTKSLGAKANEVGGGSGKSYANVT